MAYVDYPYGSMYGEPVSQTRTLWNVLRGRVTWWQWREHREYLAKRRADEGWNRREEAFLRSLPPEYAEAMRAASRMLSELRTHDHI